MRTLNLLESQPRFPSRIINVNHAPHYELVVALRAKTIVEWAERMRSASLATEYDVTVLLDGRRFNCHSTVAVWLREVEANRAEEAANRDVSC